MVAILALLIAVVISRFVIEAGLKSLSVEQKGHLVEAMSGFRKYALLLWVGFALLTYKMPWLIAYGIGVYLVAYQVLILRQVRRLGLPGAYFRYSVASSLVVIVGLAVYSGLLKGWL
jgi:hypothetical protein